MLHGHARPAPENAEIGAEMRARRLGHRPAVVWLTGLPAAGKSTIARSVEARLFHRGVLAARLDGDDVRRSLCADLGFSPADRSENVRRIAEVAALLARVGAVVIVAVISPSADARARARAICRDFAFLEVFVDCPLAVCEARDPKGLYARARRFAIADFTGVSAPYEPPEAPAVHLRAGSEPVEVCAERVIAGLEAEGVVVPAPPRPPCEP